MVITVLFKSKRWRIDLVKVKSKTLEGSYKKHLSEVIQRKPEANWIPPKKWTWACGGLKKNIHLNVLNAWARDTVIWHWSANTLFWRLSIGHDMDVQYQVNQTDCIWERIVNIVDNLQKMLRASVSRNGFFGNQWKTLQKASFLNL